MNTEPLGHVLSQIYLYFFSRRCVSCSYPCIPSRVTIRLIIKRLFSPLIWKLTIPGRRGGRCPFLGQFKLSRLHPWFQNVCSHFSPTKSRFSDLSPLFPCWIPSLSKVGHTRAMLWGGGTYSACCHTFWSGWHSPLAGCQGEDLERCLRFCFGFKKLLFCNHFGQLVSERRTLTDRRVQARMKQVCSDVSKDRKGANIPTVAVKNPIFNNKDYFNTKLW